MNELDKILIKTDILLKPTADSLSNHIMELKTEINKSENARNEVIGSKQYTSDLLERKKILDILEDFEEDIKFLQSADGKNLPNEITDLTTSIQWDMYLLKTECVKFLCGIPGELKCHECKETFKSVHKKIIHEIKKHGTSKDVQPYSCEFCYQVIIFIHTSLNES